MPARDISSELDTVGRRIGLALERVYAAYGQWNARRAVDKGSPIPTGMDDRLLYDLGLNRIEVKVGFVKHQH
jgi:hypothetical protein